MPVGLLCGRWHDWLIRQSQTIRFTAFLAGAFLAAIITLAAFLATFFALIFVLWVAVLSWGTWLVNDGVDMYF